MKRIIQNPEFRIQNRVCGKESPILNLEFRIQKAGASSRLSEKSRSDILPRALLSRGIRYCHTKNNGANCSRKDHEMQRMTGKNKPQDAVSTSSSAQRSEATLLSAPCDFQLPSSNSPSSTSGMALVIVLSMLALVTIVAVSFTMFSLLESRNARNFKKSVEGNFMVDLAIGDAMQKIIAGTPQVGTNYYWVSAPGRLWRVGGGNSVGATNRLFPTNQYFTPSYSGDYNVLSNESGYINLFSESTNVFNSVSPNSGFHPTNIFVNLNGSQRAYKIAPDPTPSGLSGQSQIPLTVPWVQISRDLAKPISANNPVVGRYAYWVDAENARLNINDIGITNRIGWRGLSPQEFAVDGILAGITAANMDTYRKPLQLTSGSPNLPLLTYTNKAFFRKVDDLRLAGVTDTAIKNNSFYLTAVGRDIEVDNAGRIPIQIDKYNGSTNAFIPAALNNGTTGTPGSLLRNNPNAEWGSDGMPSSEMPYLGQEQFDFVAGSSGNGPDTTNVMSQTLSGTTDLGMGSLWQGLLDGTTTPLADPYSSTMSIVFVSATTNDTSDPDNPVTVPVNPLNISANDVENAIVNVTYECTTNYLDIQPGPPLPGGTPNSPSPNLSPYGTNIFLQTGVDWLPRRMMNTNSIYDTTKANTENSYPYDLVMMQRLMSTNTPSSFIAGEETNSNNVGGKYTWNELSQLLANINSWRQSNIVEYSKGSFILTNNLGSEIQKDGEINNFRTFRSPSSGFNPPTKFFTRGQSTYPVILNQNMGYKSLPYINEIGFGISNSGGYLENLSLFVELWNPAAPAPSSMVNTPYNLGVVYIMPEAAYSYATGNPGVENQIPEAHPYMMTNASPVLFGNNGNGPASNPERFRMGFGRTVNNDIEPAARVAYTGGPSYNSLVFQGSFWSSPEVNGVGGVFPFQVYGGGLALKNATNNHISSLSGGISPTVTNGGAMGWYGRTVPQISYFNNRAHVPIVLQDVTINDVAKRDSTATVIIKNAHLVDWRIPQHLDISLFPIFEGNYQTDPFGGYWGGLKVRFNGINGSAIDGNGRINMAVAVGLVMLPTNVVDGFTIDGIPSFAGGYVSDTLTAISPTMMSGTPPSSPPSTPSATRPKTVGTFYDSVPQPRINPLDLIANTSSAGNGVPQTKFLPFLEVSIPIGQGVFISREVDDPRVNDRSAFVDFSDTTGSDTNNLINTYDANDWGPMNTSVNNTTLRSMKLLTTADVATGPGNYNWSLNYNYRQWETVKAGDNTFSRGNSWGNNAGEVGATNRMLGQVWTNIGNGATNWGTAISGANKAPFTGRGDGDGDLTSQLIKGNDLEHPAELGYVHTGRPWRTLHFGKTGTNFFDTATSVPDWYFFDLFSSVPISADSAGQVWSLESTNKTVGVVSNPRRGTMALNPRIYTADPGATNLNQARLKPLYSMFNGVVTGQTLTNLVQAVYMPTNSIAGSYEGYVPGVMGDRFGIPGIIDSPGELSEVFGRFTTGTLNASAPYTSMATNVWGGSTPTISSDGSSGASSVFSSGWAGVSYDSSAGAVTLSATNSAFPKELLRAVGAQMSPRSRFFHIYVCVQTFNPGTLNKTTGQPDATTKIASEIWKEVLVERDNRYNEYAYKPQYRIVWEKSL